jgi:uncharacterized protein (DUF2141 family)
MISNLSAGNLATLNVSVKNVDSTKGIMYISVCSKSAFENQDYNNCIASATKKIGKAESYNFVFTNIPFGEWAIFGYIDENLNERVDYNDTGMPTEPVIFNNILSAEPTFDFIKVIVNKEKQDVVLLAQ